MTIFITMTAESALIPIPSEIVMPFSGYLVYKGQLNLILVGLIASLANLIGSLIAYIIGFYGGRNLIIKYGKYIFLSQHHLEKADYFFAKYGDISILIGRCLPIIRTFISLPAGFGKMHIVKFTLYTFLGSLPWNFALSTIGYYLGENWNYILQITKYLDLIILMGIFVLILWFIYRLIIRKTNKT